MLALRSVLALALVASSYAGILLPRANTNAAISPIVDQVDMTMRHVGPDILTITANQTLSTATLTPQFNRMNTSFTAMRTGLAGVAVSSGSTTTHPTNDDLSKVVGDAVVLVATSLSGVKATGKVPNFAALVSSLDPTIAGALKQFNTTSPNGLALVHIIMIDARQFLVAEGFTQTNAALGF
ncbi:hypothetical protein MKEN_00410200 [Mycena kentingensis (nom. inval.)]|nr:hypothetical protein MKEN_00410200 [Mycena kentingensis (nom. inval.)]